MAWLEAFVGDCRGTGIWHFRWFIAAALMNWQIFQLSQAEQEALWLSLQVAALATAGALPVAGLVAYALARRKFLGRSLLNIIIVLPLVLPPVVTGYLLLLGFGANGIIGKFLGDYLGIHLAFRWTGAALAAAVMSFPLMVRSIRLSFETIDTRLEQAAATLGATRLQVFLFVTLPLAMPGILAAVVLGLAKSLGEFGATIAFVANIPGETQTLSLAIYTQLQIPGGEPAAYRLLVISLILAVAAVAFSEILGRRGRAP